VKFAPSYRPPTVAKKIVVHGHCHHRATMSMKDEMTLLGATGAEVQLLDSGCCGMAGPFGFEKEKFEVSQTLGERVLLPEVRRQTAALIVSDGFSCREQIAQNSERRGMHLAEVLAGRRQE
jgi:Fe-S oxidoreductase